MVQARVRNHFGRGTGHSLRAKSGECDQDVALMLGPECSVLAASILMPEEPLHFVRVACEL